MKHYPMLHDAHLSVLRPEPVPAPTVSSLCTAPQAP